MVSVIVPVYNAEKTIVACVQSILNQNYTDFELILIDDGSTDRSGQLCDQLQERCKAENVLCQVIHQLNCGVSAARNCGIEHARGEYFTCVDSDDLVEPCYLEDLVHTAETHPELGCVLCGFRCSSHVHNYIYSDQEELSILDRSNYMLLLDKILVQSPCLALYRTQLVRSCHIKMREDLSLAEDTLFNLDYLDALDQTAIGVINKPNYIYMDEDQSSLYRKYRKDLLSVYETVNQAIFQCLKKWNITDVDSWKRYYQSAFYKYCTVLKNTFHKNNPLAIREKYEFNNSILRSEAFREALVKGSDALPSWLFRAYQSGNYRKVIAVEKAQSFKRWISAALK